MGMTPRGVQGPDARASAGPVHRLIVAVDVEGSTMRTNPVKGELRRNLYRLLGQALGAAGITAKHLEPHTDRGDGVLILIRPYDEVPKTLVLGRLVPILTALLIKHNASVTRPEMRLRLRAVVHAGEVHEDGRGFYGDDIDVACRLLDTPKLKRALREAAASPLVLVVSEEIFTGIIQQGYFDGGTIPAAGPGAGRPPGPPGLGARPGPGSPLTVSPRSPGRGGRCRRTAASLAPGERAGQDQPGEPSGRGQRARSASTRAGMTWCRSPMMA